MKPNIVHVHRVSQITIAFGLLALTIALSIPPNAQAVPTQVYVCTEVYPYLCADGQGVQRYGPFPFENDYVATVLKNEWGVGSTYMQALYAGAVTIRTFGQRSARGCGAIAYDYTDGLPVEDNVSQRYFPNTGVLQAHRDAANQTAGITILRFNDGTTACAKYRADVGNPTLAYSETDGSPTGQSVPDNVNFSNTGHDNGMGQNGSIAWSIGTSSIRLNWPQIVGKYYTRIGLSAGTNNTGILIPKNNYRWTWTDVTATTDWTGVVSGKTYHSPKANTPTTMRPNCTYQVPLTIFNGSKVTFYSEGSANPTRLSYHWYNVYWQTVTWDGIRTPLGGDLGFGAQRILQAQVKAPSTVGPYYLTWDLVQEGITWYEWKNGTRQEIFVYVTGTPCP
jgi:hypothetical protein